MTRNDWLISAAALASIPFLAMHMAKVDDERAAARAPKPLCSSIPYAVKLQECLRADGRHTEASCARHIAEGRYLGGPGNTMGIEGRDRCSLSPGAR